MPPGSMADAAEAAILDVKCASSAAPASAAAAPASLAKAPNHPVISAPSVVASTDEAACCHAKWLVSLAATPPGTLAATPAVAFAGVRQALRRSQHPIAGGFLAAVHGTSTKQATPAPSLADCSRTVDRKAHDLELRIEMCNAEIGELVVSKDSRAKWRALQVMQRRQMYQTQRDILKCQQLNIDSCRLHMTSP